MQLNWRWNSARCLTVLAGSTIACAAAAEPPRSTQPAPVIIDTQSLPPRSLMAWPAAPPVPEWLETHLRIGHLPPDAGRMTDRFARAGYNVIIINALRKWDIVGPTASLYPAAEVQGAEDYMRRFVERVHAAGAKALFYIGPVQVPAFSPEFVKAHPDWLRIGRDGKPDGKPNHVNFRSGYGAWLGEQLEYVTRAFKADGFWLDGYAPVHLHTYDAATRAQFAAVSGGRDIPHQFDPVADPVGREYLRWHEQYFVDFALEMRAAVRRANPEAVLFVNHSGSRTWYSPDMLASEYPGNYSGAIDVSSVEQYWDMPGDALYQQFVYAFMQGVTRDHRSSVWIQPSAHGISGVSAPVEIQLRGLECLPWGVYPEFVEPTGREEYMETHVANIKAREEWLKRTEPIPFVGIVASEQTRALAGKACLPVYLSHTLGAFRALSEEHLPLRILTEYDLEDADLRGVRVLFLANVAVLSDRAAEVVRRFVRAGGGLVASLETSLYDESFRPRTNFALADMLGADYARTHRVDARSENLLLRLEARHPISDDPAILAKQNTSWQNPSGPPPEQGNLALIASAVEASARGGAAVVCSYRLTGPGAPDRVNPAIVASTYGQGRVVYVAAGLDKAMFFYPDAFQRRLLTRACRWAAGESPPPFEVEGPLLLGTTYRRQPGTGRSIVHLLNHASSWGMHSAALKVAPLPEPLRERWGYTRPPELGGTWPVREETVPLRDVKVTCRLPGVRRATLQPENLRLEMVSKPGAVEVVVPKIVMHSMVVFESE
jgi:hypothetical protein